MNLFDSSALLCFLGRENGWRTVEHELTDSARCSAANWSEVAQKVAQHGGDWSLARALLLSYGLQVVPVVAEDAEQAAARWRKGSGLSLADRLCLATGDRLDAAVWTADTAWGRSGRVRQISRSS
ncbi:MAG: PIN domain-containing protein [Dermatophilaceae bacterium]